MKSIVTYLSIFSVLLCMILISCDGGNADMQKIKLHKMNEIAPEFLQKLHHQKIFFAHQSVGNNIIEGMKELGAENPDIRLDIKRIEEFAPLKSPGFYHADIGKNDYPKTKIDAFVQAMDSGIGTTADMALLKFCFVDITANTDVNELFSYYEEKMKGIHEKYPDLKLIHVTVPLLRRNEPTIKTYIKKLLGKGDGFFDDSHNIARNRFNELLRQGYSGKEPLFDLAMFESAYPDGSRCSFKSVGETFYSLLPDYTDDGGHLNSKGRKVIAEQLICFLSTMVR